MSEKFAHPHIKKQKVNVKKELYGYPTGILSTNISRLWIKDYLGQGIVIGLVDSGVDSSHSDLSGRVIREVSYGKQKNDSHGTHVAGTICASAEDGYGFYGMAPKSKLISHHILDSTGGSPVDYVKAIYSCIKDDVDIINCSIGMSGYDMNVYISTIKAINEGIIVVAASGNSGSTAILYPAYIEGVISVTNFDVPRNKHNISSTINKQVDLTAPGTGVISCVFNNKYEIFSGTSMATPHVTGYIACLLSCIKDKYPNLSKIKRRNMIMDIIMNRDNLVDEGKPGFDIQNGWGRIKYEKNEENAIETIGNNEYYHTGKILSGIIL